MVYYRELRDLDPEKSFSVFWKLRYLYRLKKDRVYQRDLLREILVSLPRRSGDRPKKLIDRAVKYIWMELFTCKCGWLLYHPCTLSCGHTICKLCFKNFKFCTICGAVIGQEFIANTTLAGLLERWHPAHYRAAEMKMKAKDLVAESNHAEAVDLLNDVLKSFEDDFIALNLRSEAYLGLGNLKLCYKDAKKSCNINETCGESYFRLGEAYATLNKLDDAVEAFNTCLEVEPEDERLNTKVCDSLDRLLSMSPRQEIDLSDDEENYEEPKANDARNYKQDQKMPELSEKESDVKGMATNCNVSGNTYKLFEGDSLTDSAKLPLSSQVTDGIRNDSVQMETQEGKTCKVPRTLKKPEDACTVSSTQTPSSSVVETVRSISCKRSCSTSNENSDSSTTLGNKRLKMNDGQDPHLDDFECKLCFCILFRPVTTACGHVFCQICLEKCIDYNPSCPICRRKLTCTEENGVGRVTEVIEKAIEHYFPEEIKERKEKHNKRMETLARVGEDEEVEVPILDCTLALPTIQCPLHIFEPKYKTMLRESLHSGSMKFGMCKSDNEGGHSNYGTIMEIRHVRFLPDGRSIIDSVGGRRFKIDGTRKNDGVSHAKVQYFEDDTSAFQSEIAREQLLNKCRVTYDTVSSYIGNLHPSERECIVKALGPMPLPQPDPLDCANGESWVWWAASALPLNDKARLIMFKSQSLGDRVTILQRFVNVLGKVQRNRQLNETSRS